jgi:hypothetical protein
MTLIEASQEYLNGKNDAIQLIRTLSGMFNPENAVLLLTLICAITRIEQEDLDKDTFWKVYMKQDGPWELSDESA